MTVQYLGDCHAFVQVVAAYLSDDGGLGSLCQTHGQTVMKWNCVIHKRKKASQEGGFSKTLSGLPDCLGLTLVDCVACDAADLAAANAKVMQFAVGHAAEFGYGLTIFAPVGQGAGQVHGGASFQLVCWHIRQPSFDELNICAAAWIMKSQCRGAPMLEMHGPFTIGKHMSILQA
jgi:hypothetical protein